MPKSAFAERLQRLMMEKGLSQSDLAREIWGKMTDERGYDVAKNRQVIGKYLAGKVTPRTGTMRSIAKALDVPLSEIDPASDPTRRPGSGILVEPVDKRSVRIEINVVAPKAVAREVVAMLTPYTV